jgi:D-glycero-D-manno-heptose 1,7-bisphosphate phosphatase
MTGADRRDRAIFLDRDGVLNSLVWYESSGEWEAPRTVSDLKMIPGIAETLRLAMALGWKLFLITNQPSAAKGKISVGELAEVHETVMSRLRVEGVLITASYICFHHPHGTVPGLTGPCDCRKPNPSRLLEAAREYRLDLGSSWMVGDQDSDLRCGRAAGCRVAAVEVPESASKRFEVEPDLRCASLADFISQLIALEKETEH